MPDLNLEVLDTGASVEDTAATVASQPDLSVPLAEAIAALEVLGLTVSVPLTLAVTAEEHDAVTIAEVTSVSAQVVLQPSVVDGATLHEAITKALLTDLSAGDVTVVITESDVFWPPGTLNESFSTISFGSATKSYKLNGVPMPAIGYFGLLKEIKRLHINQPTNGYVYRWDKTHQTIRIFRDPGSAAPLAELPAGTPVAAVTLDLMAKGQ